MLKVGDEVDVKLLEYDDKSGKMRLSMRALTEKPEGYVEPERSRGPRREGGDRDRRDRGSDRGERRGSDRGDRRDRGERGDRREGRNGERRERAERHDGERSERRDSDRGSDRGERRRFGVRHEDAPAPAADDYKEPVDELY